MTIYLFDYLVIKCKVKPIKLNEMLSRIESVLNKWQRSLNKVGRVESQTMNEDYHIIGQFVRSKSKYSEIVKYVRMCRDCCIAVHYDKKQLSILISKALYAIKQVFNQKHGNSYSQTELYESITKKLYSERIKHANNRKLRTLDVSIEDGKTSRLVRRIVEKRMSQAYHRQNKHVALEGNRSRHYEKRAISYQLYNLGQVETSEKRTASTHWKQSIDPVTNTLVMKKKVAYNTLGEAQLAIVRWHVSHPNDKVPVEAYRCSYCNHYHIGHDTYTGAVATAY